MIKMGYKYIAIIKGMNGKYGLVEFSIGNTPVEFQSKSDYASWYYLNCVDDSSELIVCMPFDKWEAKLDKAPTKESVIDDAWQRSSFHWPV